MPGFPVFHYLPELASTHVHWVSDANQLSHLLPHSPALYLTGCQLKARMENWRPHHHLQVVLQPQEHPLGSSSSSNRNSSSSSICSTWPNSLELELLWPLRPERRPGQCRAQWPTGMRDERVGATWPQTWGQDLPQPWRDHLCIWFFISFLNQLKAHEKLQKGWEVEKGAREHSSPSPLTAAPYTTQEHYPNWREWLIN